MSTNPIRLTSALCALVCFMGSAFAAPPPGTVITNQGTGGFEDGAGVAHSALSNVVSLTVSAPATTAAVLVLDKVALSVAPQPNDPLDYRLTVTNTGASDAIAGPAVTIDGVASAPVLIRDGIPANTSFEAFLAPLPAGVTPLYHRVGDAEHVYSSSAPTDLSTVDAVAFAVASVAMGASLDVAFRVRLHANAAMNGSGGIVNLGRVHYQDNVSATTRIVASNLVTTPLPAVSAFIRNYTAPDYVTPADYTRLGSSLYLRADAAACNADAALVETRIAVVTGPNGERETFTATETGPNTGIFSIAAVPTRDAPVVAGNGFVEAANRDQIYAEIQGCNTSIGTTLELIDPFGVVFDSRTNTPVAGVTVTLLVGDGANGCTGTVASVRQIVNGSVQPAPNPVVTGADGRYQFELVDPGDYCLALTPPAVYSFPSLLPVGQLPPGRAIDGTGPGIGGSYGGNFRADATTGPVTIDVPLDALTPAVLFVQKLASRSIVELADFVDYAIRVRNNGGVPAGAPTVTLTDDLPAGFAFHPGSARLDGVAIADPAGGAGPRLTFDLGTLAPGQQTELRYRVRVGPGALEGDGVNRARASFAAVVSNEASTRVRVTGGVFSDRGYIVGRVFLDCNRNRIVDEEEVGIPGVRVYLEDGTSALSDSEGKYSFYGLAPRTHVLKLDMTSMPRGSQLAPTSNRNAGDPGSLFVDLKNGELAKANFAEGSCGLTVRVAVQERRAQPEPLVAETQRALGQRMEADPAPRTPGDVKAQPASGVVGAQPAVTPSFRSLVPHTAAPLALPSADDAPAATSTEALEALLPGMNQRFEFVGLKDGDTLPLAHTHVRLKGRSGTTFTLTVNGAEVPASRVGKRSVLAERRVQAWEYVGVALAPGKNELVARQFDGFGNEREVIRISVVAPDAPGRLEIVTPAAAIADGQTPAKLIVRITDRHGTPVTARTPVTLEASDGLWDVDDLDTREPGTQIFIAGGQREIALLPPEEPGEVTIRATSGALEAQTQLDVLPNLRPLIGAGTIEGVLNLRRLDSRALVPARRQDGFEQELTALSFTSGSGKRDAAARAALFLKGKIKGDYLLTLGFDSDKDTRERLFRDIQPDEFYPVYGDSSVRAFDAQSTSKLYVRVDKQRSWLLYGDFTTQNARDSRRLGIYSRSLTGAKEHFEHERLSLDAFASRDSTRQVIEEIPANGTSGPYALANASFIENSEKVEILIRDRNQPAIVLSATPQARFFDYELEPLTGRLVFKSPLPSLDPDFNPRSIRVTYEVDGGGDEFWIAGVDTQVKVHDRLQLDAIAVEDRNPQDRRRLHGLNATFKLDENTFLLAELARSHSDAIGNGNGRRLELRHETAAVHAQLYAADTDADFDNPGAWLANGRAESGAKLTWRLNDRTLLRSEALRTEDEVNGGRRTGVYASVERNLTRDVRVELGVRHGEETAIPALASSPLDLPNEFTSVRARVTSPVPHLEQASLFGEYEQDLGESARRIAAVGGDYRIAERGRLYLRHEFISSLSGPYALNRSQEQNATVFGIDTDYLSNGHVFSEYRIRDAFSGAETEAAIGLRNLWKVAEGVGLTTSFERVHVIDGASSNESLAVALGLDYTARPDWKGTARLELRDGETSRSGFTTFGLAKKLSREWSFLARNSLAITRNSGALTGERIQDRLQAGLAWRDTDTDRWSALGRIEHRYEKDDTTPGLDTRRDVELVALNANYQPAAPLTLTARYAGKWVTDDPGGMASRYDAHLIAARATYDIDEKWDAGLLVGVLASGDRDAEQYGLGFEVGRLIKTNLWLSVGYNAFGFSDDDLAGNDYTNRGGFLRLRFKFDEKLLGALE